MRTGGGRGAGGFTLVELIVVTAIVAVLTILVMPGYQEQLRNTRRGLGWAELMKVMARQEQFFLNHKRYAQTLTDLKLPENPYVIDSHGIAGPRLSRGAIYLISLDVSEHAYTLTATPQLDQAKDDICGVLSIDSSGRKHSTGEGAMGKCW